MSARETFAAAFKAQDNYETIVHESIRLIDTWERQYETLLKINVLGANVMKSCIDDLKKMLEHNNE